MNHNDHFEDAFDGYSTEDHDDHHHGVDAPDNESYDLHAHITTHPLEYHHHHNSNNMDYEPPSPSHPYTEDHESQGSQDSDSSPEDLNLDQNPKHLSEIYSQDAVSGADFDQDLSIISEYLRAKDGGWDQLASRTEPLNLLGLPLDVLRLIVKEVKHTNDLTSLALTNSTLHGLATPHIYSRFDIVWPDGPATPTEAKSVDALTYGLSTLCLGSPFARVTRRIRGGRGMHSGPLAKLSGNDYAKYTRKFSLGNGPKTWVSEYAITKESGKMLGTLVALAISKMVNLETFIWDMPTGVLSDIFMALASLSDNSESGQCMLERVWIRWHDNSDPDGTSSSSASSPVPLTIPSAVVPAGSTLTPVGVSLPSTAAHPTPKPTISYAENHVEYPTFSVLPPLKSLTVLDIDELAYLDEMAILLQRSVDSLQELRVGISSKAVYHDFVQTWDGPELEQVDHHAQWPGESTIGERRLGGVLGVLLGHIYDIRRKPSKPRGVSPLRAPESLSTAQSPQLGSSVGPSIPKDAPPIGAESETNSLVTEANTGPTTCTNPRPVSNSIVDATSIATPEGPARERLDGKLKVTTLELERVPLSMQVCNKAFDWTVLTNLTILDCAQHENLWKMLKKQFQPQPRVSGFGISPTSSKPVPNAPLQYALNLKHIHTDITSPALIAFIRETLAPNSLESLFLQDRRRSNSSTGTTSPIVSVEAIFKGAIKPHKSSLRRLLLDSSSKKFLGGSSSDSSRWRAWRLPGNILHYITSGRMSSLRELAVAIDYKDWHTFLQRLPNIPQLRSLHLPYMADHVLSKLEPKELVLQITDIITLRPEVQLCYVGIMDKCFEILENRPSDPTSTQQNVNTTSTNHAHGETGTQHAPIIVEDATDEDDTTDEFDHHEDDDDEDDDDDDSSQDEGTPGDSAEHEDTQSDHSYNDSDDDSFVEAPPTAHLRLREILFYDDKVAIFKARHGRL